MATPKNLRSMATALERYARQNIPESAKAFGEFMYHAELLRRGHLTIHRRDVATLPAKYRKVVQDMWAERS